MIPRNYYVAPLSAFQSLAGVQWEAVALGPDQPWIGHVDFSGDPVCRATFEGIAGVVSLGTLFHPSLSPEAVAALQGPSVASTNSAMPAPAVPAPSVSSDDSVFSAVEKIVGALGGLTMHY